jgi:hypothetical protein
LVNWLETEYPSPAFPSRGIESPPQVGSTQYFTAWGAARRGYPLLRGDRPNPGETDPPEVLDLMHRVTLIPTVRRTLFGPRITVFTKDGRSFTKEGTTTYPRRPAKAGVQGRGLDLGPWIPAFAGMTGGVLALNRRVFGQVNGEDLQCWSFLKSNLRKKSCRTTTRNCRRST